MPWNNGRINKHEKFTKINQLFEIINSGIKKEDFMYKGDLFRIHTPYANLYKNVDPNKEIIIGKICSDGSCFVLPYTEETSEVVSFSKSPDFTKSVYYKILHSEQAIIIHINTKNLYGIDVNAIYKKFGIKENNRFEDEQEVLFPLIKENIIKEYKCTPNQLNYYFRNYYKK